MENLELDRLIYLVILGAAVAGWFFAEHRQNIGRSVRMFMVWALIFVGLIAGYGLWDDIRSDVLPRQTVLEDGASIELPRDRGGHFHMTVEINGVPTELLVDTGATDFVLSRADARRVGIDVDNLIYTGQARTANGVVRTAFERLDEVAVGDLAFRNVGVSINEGDLDTSLLGMSFLDRFERIEIRGDRMILTP